jgi:hypothetical protein
MPTRIKLQLRANQEGMSCSRDASSPFIAPHEQNPSGQLFFIQESGYLASSLIFLLPGSRPLRLVGRSLARMERL